MKRFCYLFFMCLLCSTASAQNLNLANPEDKKILQAATDLKKAHVEREWEYCMLKTSSEKKCKSLLHVLWEQEKEVLLRINTHSQNSSINAKQLSSEFAACYDPGSTYSDLIGCWRNLANRLDDALKGNLLINSSDLCKKTN